MNEIEIKIAEAIKTLDRLLIPLCEHLDKVHGVEEALETLKNQLIVGIGRRIIKEGKHG